MPLTFLPRQLTQRAELYHQLGTLLAAGVPLISGLEMVRNSPPSRSSIRPLNRLLAELGQGATFSDALSRLSNWTPRFDLALIQAGESSGRLDVCFRYLAEYYQERARLARQVWSDLMYPALVLHFAVLIFPTSLLTRLIWQGDVAPFVWAKLAILAPLYAALALALYLVQPSRHPRWRATLERMVRAVPGLGSARANLALARLSLGLESLLNAGVPIVEAWEIAAAASGSPGLERTVRAWHDPVSAGQTPAEAVRESGAFPELFVNLYSTGEISGQLDSTLKRLYRHYEEESGRKFRIVAQWAPRMVYFIIVFLVAYQIVSFWSGYYSQIGDLNF
jgi:type IV pilus assembly protein PilC